MICPMIDMLERKFWREIGEYYHEAALASLKAKGNADEPHYAPSVVVSQEGEVVVCWGKEME